MGLTARESAPVPLVSAPSAAMRYHNPSSPGSPRPRKHHQRKWRFAPLGAFAREFLPGLLSSRLLPRRSCGEPSDRSKARAEKRRLSARCRAAREMATLRRPQGPEQSEVRPWITRRRRISIVRQPRYRIPTGLGLKFPASRPRLPAPVHDFIRIFLSAMRDWR